MDKFINTFDPKDILKFTVWDEGGVEHDAAVIELVGFCENEAERICTGKHDLHAAAGVDV